MDQETMERLRRLLGEEDVWGPPEPAPTISGDDMPTSAASQDPKDSSSGSDDSGGGADTAGQTSSVLPGRAEPKPLISARQLESYSFPDQGLQLGEAASDNMAFCPWNLITAYPSMYVGNANRDRVFPLFQKSYVLTKLAWDFFYIWNPEALDRGAILLVPTEQFNRLLSVVNATFGTQLTIPGGVNSEKFYTRFGELGTPKPRFLARTTSEADFEALQTSIPPLDRRDDLGNLKGQTPLMFVEKLDAIYKAPTSFSGKKNKSAAQKRRRIQCRLGWGRSSKRVQRYLGLRQRVKFDEENQAVSIDDPFGSSKQLDLELPVPYEPEDAVVFIAMDVELFERNHNVVTEIGFAILDTRSTIGIPPGEKLKNWLPLIKARHIRIKENVHAVNRKHVHGCEEFFNFGTSEFVHLKDSLKVTRGILQPKSLRGLPLESGVGVDANELEVRRVVLVGHDIAQDIEHVKKIGYDMCDNPQIVDIVDTMQIHQHLRRWTNPSSLGNVLFSHDLPHKNLHNGGNDAVYTLQALIALAVKTREKSLASRTEKKLNGPSNTYGYEPEGWTTGGEESDGGYAPILLSSNPNSQRATNWGIPSQQPVDYSKVRW